MKKECFMHVKNASLSSHSLLLFGGCLHGTGAVQRTTTGKKKKTHTHGKVVKCLLFSLRTNIASCSTINVADKWIHSDEAGFCTQYNLNLSCA